jgi:transcriptional regulator with XRE-family HTH domain
MCELLERARKAQGDISYYEVAKRLGISTPLMNKWKNNKSQPNGINTLMLADMAGVTPKEALKIMQGGFSDVSLIIMTALLCNAGVAYSLISKFCILC